MVLMSAELMATIIGTAITITALASTILYSNKTLREGQKNTQRIIEEGNKNTQEILKGHEEILRGHDKILGGIAHTTHKIAHLTEKVASYSEVEFELQGIKIAENVESEEEAKKLGELIKYHPNLKLAYYRPKRSTA